MSEKHRPEISIGKNPDQDGEPKMSIAKDVSEDVPEVSVLAQKKKQERDQESALRGAFTIFFRGVNIKPKEKGESEDVFELRKKAAEVHFRAAVRLLEDKFKVDLSRPGAMELLRAHFKNKLAKKALGKDKKSAAAARKDLRQIFEISGDEAISAILDSDSEDDETTQDDRIQAVRRATEVALPRLAAQGDVTVAAQLLKKRMGDEEWGLLQSVLQGHENAARDLQELEAIYGIGGVKAIFKMLGKEI